MRLGTRSFWLSVAVIAALSPCGRVQALIRRDLPLAAVFRESRFIAQAKVVKFDATNKRLVADVVKDFKGKLPFRKLYVNLARSKVKGDAEKMIKRLQLGLPLVIFAVRDKNSFLFLGFTEGTWFSMKSLTPPPPRTPGPDEVKKPAGAVCSFTACEIYLRRTYAGKTKELLKLLPGVLAGRQKPPPFDKTRKPDLGPEIEQSGKK